MKKIISAWPTKVALIAVILVLVLIASVPPIIKPYTVHVRYGEEEISFMPYTSRMWNVKIGGGFLTLSSPARQDPINVIFRDVSSDEIKQLFDSMCWEEQRPFLISQFSKYQLFRGWRPHSPILEFAIEDKSNPHQRLHIRIFDNGEKGGTHWLLGAIHQEYYDKLEDTHIIISYESAEELLVENILDKTSAKIAATLLINKVFWEDKENDGRATIIDFKDINITDKNRRC